MWYVWINIYYAFFSICIAIQYIEVMESGVIPAIPGTFPVDRFWGGERARRV